MKWTTYKHTLTGWWDLINITDQNWAESIYESVIMIFSWDITVRWNNWQEEIILSSSMSPIELQWSSQWWFPYEVKWSWDLFFLTNH